MEALANAVSTFIRFQTLKDMLADGSFHHATYRDHGTVWEGLKVYVRDKGPSGFLGYRFELAFSKGAESDLAYDMTRHTGVSVGKYGSG